MESASFDRTVGKTMNVTHAILCDCNKCTESQRLSQTRITHDGPMGALDPKSVSLRELVDNVTLTMLPRYVIGEDWSDD